LNFLIKINARLTNQNFDSKLRVKTPPKDQ
jgi:hypothetical protein